MTGAPALLTLLGGLLLASASTPSHQAEGLGPVHKVKRGMTAEQVQDILGRPKATHPFLGVDELHYCGPPSRHVIVYIDAGRVLDKAERIDPEFDGPCPATTGGTTGDYRVSRRVRDVWESRAPPIIAVSGHTLAQPIYLRGWNENWELLAGSSPANALPDLRSRPFYTVSLFWGALWWPRSIDWSPKLRDANQHARLYPATALAPALLVFDDEPGKWAGEARRSGLVRAIGPEGLAILAKARVPVR